MKIDFFFFYYKISVSKHILRWSPELRSRLLYIPSGDDKNPIYYRKLLVTENFSETLYFSSQTRTCWGFGRHASE